uniref:Uncharacterized protein n=1 Tax=Anguilla anguilla TaxID=7936 RepID=A0A0E9RII9_ANGAN
MECINNQSYEYSILSIGKRKINIATLLFHLSSRPSQQK